MTYPKKLNGLCVGTLSADRVVLQGPLDKEQGGYKQKVIHLANIVTPKTQENWGFAARELVRTRLVGEMCDIVIVKKVGEVEVGHVLLNGKDIGRELLTQGLGRMRSEKGENAEEYRAAQEQAEAAGKGLWSPDARQQKRPLDPRLTDSLLFEGSHGKALEGVVEEIHPSKALIYFPTHRHMATLLFSEVQIVVLSQKTQNDEKKNNARAIRSTLQSFFLNRNVNVFLSAFEEQLIGYIQCKGQDVRKVLLANGFAKLGKQAMAHVSTKQFLELKHVAETALQEAKGLWKDQKIKKKEGIDPNSYFAVVIEVHSGDSLTVAHENGKDKARIFLPNIRAASFEAKQFLRKALIGQKVRIEVEFAKKIKKEGETEGRDFTFASVLKGGSNMSVALLEHGLALLQAPRVEEDVSKYFQELREADERTKKSKKTQPKKDPTFNDLSGGKGKKIDAAKCKAMYTFLKDDPRLVGVIELVLNGSRFKVRLLGHNVMAIIVLQGVRCLPNEGPFAKASEQALQYSKSRINQRDVGIQLKKVDNKGVFHARITLEQKDYAAELLEHGMAVSMPGRVRQPLYEQIQSVARKSKTGLWKTPLNLSTIKGEIEREFKPINYERKATLVDIISGAEFYLQMDSNKPEIPQDPKGVQNVEVGQIYSAKFSDGLYHRARVIREVGNARFYVQYIDYGNYETVNKASLAQLSEPLRKFKSPLNKCTLYGVENLTPEGTETFKELIGDQLKVLFKEESEAIGNDPAVYKVILMDKDDNVNLRLIEFGEAECAIEQQQWVRTQQLAKKNKEGKWGREQ